MIVNQLGSTRGEFPIHKSLIHISRNKSECKRYVSLTVILATAEFEMEIGLFLVIEMIMVTK